MGEVYAATAIGPDGVEKLVAVKLVREDQLKDPHVIQMFVEEAKVAFLLTHPNIVQTYELGEIDGHYFLVMEYVDGINLEDLIHVAIGSLKQPLPAAYALYIGAQIARGLAYAHELTDRQGGALNIVHRDVSPTNVLLSSAGQVKVTDFGIAKSLMQRVESQGAVAGKLGYMAPEQLRSGAVDARTDIYALGVTLYEMLVGENPFGRHKLGYSQRLSAVIVPLAERAPQLDPRIVELVGRCVADELADRWSSARELGRAIDGCMRALGLHVSDYELADFIARAKTIADEQRPEPAPGPHPFERALGLELDRIGGGPTAANAPSAGRDVVTFVARRSTPRVASAHSSTMARLPETVLTPTSDSLLAPAPAHTAVLLKRLHRWPWATLAALLLGAAALWIAWPQPDTPSRADRSPDDRASTERTAAASSPVSPDAPSDASTQAMRPPPARPDARPRGSPLRKTRARRPTQRTTARSHKERMGRLSVNSEPWSIVYLDGQRIRSTPIIGYAVAEGPHTVRLVNPTRRIDVEHQVVVRPNETTRLSVTLEK